MEEGLPERRRTPQIPAHLSPSTQEDSLPASNVMSKIRRYYFWKSSFLFFCLHNSAFRCLLRTLLRFLLLYPTSFDALWTRTWGHFESWNQHNSAHITGELDCTAESRAPAQKDRIRVSGVRTRNVCSHKPSRGFGGTLKFAIHCYGLWHPMLWWRLQNQNLNQEGMLAKCKDPGAAMLYLPKDSWFLVRKHHCAYEHRENSMSLREKRVFTKWTQMPSTSVCLIPRLGTYVSTNPQFVSWPKEFVLLGK